ncbi:hypothetical protein FOQG_05874 [Fusarium oxysporum f. sp. raphani 54005]|uniref:Uncharacterized protein n=2 Tax=Fusarium oxysporum TaxID=5507 RepID=X0CKN1_FUSOX|nr:hypothetical protein FOQG_05874 [Fusarium oxysporum f. sp. raphani 54005]EXL74498.1 hypothetical protein FOPG_10386 [Fusarium oxysporum f. sp. conglutinans race 2 54008]
MLRFCNIEIILLCIDTKLGDSFSTRANFTFGVNGRPKTDSAGVDPDELLLSLSGVLSLFSASSLKDG